MAATAAARKTAPRATARTRRATRPAPVRATPRRSGPAPRLVPLAVGRTAVAVGGIADSGIVLRLTRSRLWIGALGTLLVGIVALNVFALSLNAASSKTAAISDELRRENSALTSQIADGLSNERLQAAADRLGLIAPEPGAILYLDPRPGDAAAAAKRLRNGAITIGSTYVPPAPPVLPEPTPAPAEPVTEEAAPVEPVATGEAAATETPTTVTDPAATAPPSVAAGGITAP